METIDEPSRREAGIAAQAETLVYGATPKENAENVTPPESPWPGYQQNGD